MTLVKLHRCGYNTGTYPKGEPIWVNPAFVVAAWPEEHMLHGVIRTYSKLRLHGDGSHQDWTLIWESPDEVIAALTLIPSQTASQGEKKP